MGADHMDIDPRRCPLDASQIVPVVLHKICLGQQNHRSRPGLPGKGQIPLQPPGVEVMVQGLQDEHIVKIRRHGLKSGHSAGRSAGEHRPPGLGSEDQAVSVFDVLHGHIVSRSGELRPLHMVFLRLQAAEAFALFTDQLITLPVHRRDPGGDDFVIFQWYFLQIQYFSRYPN